MGVSTNISAGQTGKVTRSSRTKSGARTGQRESNRIRGPRTDDHLLYDVIFRINAYQAVVVAYELKLFALLAENPRTLQEVCTALNLGRRPGELLLTICRSLGLLRMENHRYCLEAIAEDYLLDDSPTHFGKFIDVSMLSDPSVFSYERVRKAFLTDKSQVYDGDPLFQTHEEQASRAHAFTHMMHGHSMGPALGWPESIDLGEHRIMLDIGGGSGAHAIGATQRWPDLSAIVLDLRAVCEVADEYIARHRLQDRIRTLVGDMWDDPFPPADLHFYSNIYHDWPAKKGRFLSEKSFASLRSGGRIIIHEMLYDDDKTGPLTVAGLSVGMLLWAEGQQFSGRELSAMLADAGFTDIEVRPTFGYWSIVSGRKP